MQVGRLAARRGPDLARWANPIAVGVALLGSIALLLALTLWIERAEGWAFDFQAYYDAAQRLIATGSPYQAVTLEGPFSPTGEGMYLYSPVPVVAMLPLAALGADSAAIAWLIVRLACFAAACALMPVGRAVRLYVFGIGAVSWPVLHDLNLGNISIVVLFLAVLAWRLEVRPRAPYGAGLAVALAAAIRPPLAVAVLPWLLRREWKQVFGFIGGGVALVAVTLPFVGVAGWLDYGRLLRNVAGSTGVINNGDLGSAVIHLGLPAWLAPVMLAIGALVALVAVVLASRRDRELALVVALIASLLLAPVLWSHYLVLLLVPAAFLAARGRPWALLLPLLGWLPAVAVPFVTLAALWLPFLARARAVGPPADGTIETS